MCVEAAHRRQLYHTVSRRYSQLEGSYLFRKKAPPWKYTMTGRLLAACKSAAHPEQWLGPYSAHSAGRALGCGLYILMGTGPAGPGISRFCT